MTSDLMETADRLENWGRWARSRPAPARTRSLEGRYRPERGDLDDERRSPAPDVDALDASRVDRAIAPASGFPIRWSLLLKAHFVIRADRQATARRLCLTCYEADLHRATVAARNVLTRAGR